MRPQFERVATSADSSWTLLNRRLESGIPFEWHHHPEFEMTLTTNSRGQRFVGDSIGAYGDGDLVLLGPNVPHTWFSGTKIDPASPHVAIVMWFRMDWAERLTGAFVEMRDVQRMLAAAGRGTAFSAASTAKVRPLIEAMPDLDGASRLLNLIEVLHLLACDTQAVPLASPAFRASAVAGSDRDRIGRILDHIHTHYHTDIRIEDLAEISCLSVSGFQRLFRRHTRLAVMEYTNQLRVGQACALLLSTERPVAHVAETVGYRNLSNFNRQFLRAKQMTPRAFRLAYRRSGRPSTQGRA